MLKNEEEPVLGAPRVESRSIPELGVRQEMGENAGEDRGRKDSQVLTAARNPLLSAPDVCALLMGVVAFIIFILLLKGNAALVSDIIREDGFIENLSALFWIQASVICIYRITATSQQNKLLLSFWAVFCFLCFGEETSWGQRILGYSLHSVQAMSAQNEVNLHNLDILSTHLGLSKTLTQGGAINWSGFLNAQNLFYIGFIIYFLFFPFLSKIKALKPLKEKFHYIAPSYIFILSAWSVIIFSFIAALYTDRFRAMIETREMFMAFVVLFYVIFYLWEEPYGKHQG